MESEVYFADEKLKEVYNNLEDSKAEEKELHKWISRAIDDLKKDAFTGIQIKKELIPSEYKQKIPYMDNLWKYDMPKGWRLLYTVGKDKVIVVSIV